MLRSDQKSILLVIAKGIQVKAIHVGSNFGFNYPLESCWKYSPTAFSHLQRCEHNFQAALFTSNKFNEGISLRKVMDLRKMWNNPIPGKEAANNSRWWGRFVRCMGSHVVLCYKRIMKVTLTRAELQSEHSTCKNTILVDNVFSVISKSS